MPFSKDKLQEIVITIDSVIDSIYDLEQKYKPQITNVHPNYTRSAKNLVHYLAFRSFDINQLQDKLDEIGLSYSFGFNADILQRILNLKTIIYALLKIDLPKNEESPARNEVKKILQKNTTALFGEIRNKRNTAIMVTQPHDPVHDNSITKSLLKLGMNSARINCAHGDEIIWKQIIDTFKTSEIDCKIMMDLGGPKLRTGKMKPGYKVIHIKPKKNTLGQVVTPAKIWLAPYGMLPPEGEIYDAVVPVNKKWLQKTRKGSYIVFKDSRGKKCKITIVQKEGNGRWGSCYDSSFVTTGTFLNVFIEKKSSSEIHTVHEILPLEEVIFLFEGDLLRVDKKHILGEPAIVNKANNTTEIAHISCTLPEVFDVVKREDKIYFNDGKIEGFVKEVLADHFIVEITNTKRNGGKLRADKGINMPNTDLGIRGLTKKDKEDLKFVVKNADAVNFSFVNNKHDVQDLILELKKLNAEIGIILKVETQEAFKNLPSILLKAMENYPIGVMIARGDLAIEIGWKNFAVVQEEIFQLCNAAHLPVIWATQVLENLAKKGIPTRAEITDIAMAQRTDCIMLNKGPYIEKAVKMLDAVLCKMQQIQKDKRALLPRLEFNEDL